MEIGDPLAPMEQLHPVSVPVQFSEELGSAKIDVAVFSHSRTAAQCADLRFIKDSTALRAYNVLDAQSAVPFDLDGRISAFKAEFDSPLSGMISVSLRRSYDLVLEPGRLGAQQSVLLEQQTPFTFPIDYHVADAMRFVPISQGRRLMSLNSAESNMACGESAELILPTVFRYDEYLKQWDTQSCRTRQVSEGRVLAECLASGTFSVRMAVRTVSGPTCDIKQIEITSFVLASVFVLAAVAGLVQITRVTRANGKCKASLIFVVHWLEVCTAIMFGAYTVLTDLYTDSPLLAILRLAAFSCVGAIFSALLYVWNSIYHFSMKIRSPTHTKKHIQIANAVQFLFFIGASVVLIVMPERSMIATIAGVTPVSLFALFEFALSLRLVRRTKLNNPSTLNRQTTGLSRTKTGLSNTHDTTGDRKNTTKVVLTMFRFVALQSVFVTMIAAQIAFDSTQESSLFVRRVILVATEFLSLCLLLAAFNGLVSSTAKLNTAKRLRMSERKFSTATDRKSERLQRMKSSRLVLQPQDSISSQTESTSEGSSTGSVSSITHTTLSRSSTGSVSSDTSTSSSNEDAQI
jgi:hypothetical protein